MSDGQGRPTPPGVGRKPRALPANAMLEQTEPTLERCYGLMGEALLFQTNDPALLEAAERSFGRFAPAPPDPAASPLVLRLYVHGDGSRAGASPAAGRPRPIFRTQGHLFYINLGADSTAVADLLQGYAFGFVSAEVARNQSLVCYVFLEGLALAMLGPARQFIPLHAGCVVKEGASLILSGESGRGKSTLALACVRRGYRMLSEDGLFLKCRPGAAQLWGLPWRLHLLPDVKRFFPELAAEQPHLQINGEWKLEIDLERFYPGSAVTNASPGPVVFLEQGPDSGPVQIEPVARQEIAGRLQVVWPWWVGWTDEMERQLARLVELGAYRLRTAGSPQEAVDALDALLSGRR